MTLGEWMKAEQEALGLTATECAARAGMSVQVWCRWANDERRPDGTLKQPRMATVEAIARGLGKPVEEVVSVALLVPLRRPDPDLRFAREMEPILRRAGERRNDVERTLRRSAEEIVELLNRSA